MKFDEENRRLDAMPALIGKALTDLGLLEAPDERKKNMQSGCADAPAEHRHRLRTVDGRELHLLITAWPIPYRGCAARLRTLRDVTERCRSYGAMRNSEDRLAALMNNIQLMISEITVDGVLINVNSAALQAVAPNWEDVIGSRSSNATMRTSFACASSADTDLQLLDQPRAKKASASRTQ